MATSGRDSAEHPSIWRPLLNGEGDAASWTPAGLGVLAAGMLLVATVTPPREPSIEELPGFAPLITYAATYPSTPMPDACAALLGSDPTPSGAKRAPREVAPGDAAELARRCDALRLQVAQAGRSQLALTVARGPGQPGWLSAALLVPGGFAWLWAAWLAFLLTPTLLSRLGAKRLAAIVAGGALGSALGAYLVTDDPLQPNQLGGLLPAVMGCAYALSAGGERLRVAEIFGLDAPARWAGQGAASLSPWAPALAAIVLVVAGVGVSASLSARFGALAGAVLLAWALSVRQGGTVAAPAPTDALTAVAAPAASGPALTPVDLAPARVYAIKAAAEPHWAGAPGASAPLDLGLAAPLSRPLAAPPAAPPALTPALPFAHAPAAPTAAAPAASAADPDLMDALDAAIHNQLEAVAGNASLEAAASALSTKAPTSPPSASSQPAAAATPAGPPTRAFRPQRGRGATPPTAPPPATAPAAAPESPDAATVSIRGQAATHAPAPAQAKAARSPGAQARSDRPVPPPGASAAAAQRVRPAVAAPPPARVGEQTERVEEPDRRAFALRSAVVSALPVADGTEAYDPSGVAEVRAQIANRRSSEALLGGEPTEVHLSTGEALAQAPRRDVHLRERTTAGLLLVVGDGREVHLRPHDVRAIHAAVCDSIGPEPVLDLYVVREGALERWHLPWRGIHRARLLAGAAPQLAWATLSVELAGGKALRLPRGATWPPTVLPRYADENAMAAAARRELEVEPGIFVAESHTTDGDGTGR